MRIHNLKLTMRQHNFLFWILLLLGFASACEQKTDERISENEDRILVDTENYQLAIQKEGFRYEIRNASSYSEGRLSL